VSGFHGDLWFSMVNFHYTVPHPCSLDEANLLSRCELLFTRRGGPGGQHRNKVESAVVITHVASSITAESNERRDQHQNRRVAIARLRIHLAWLVRGYPSDDVEAINASPTQLWSRRNAKGRLLVSVDHWDFAELLAEAIDRLFLCGLEVSTAAEHLGVSSGQLVKLLRCDRGTLTWINQQRQKLDFPTLR